MGSAGPEVNITSSVRARCLNHGLAKSVVGDAGFHAIPVALTVNSFCASIIEPVLPGTDTARV